MMQLDAAGRDALADPAALRLPPAALLVVAGVPGAGKTTWLSRVQAPGSVVLDPETVRARLERPLGRFPYRLWRPLVHTGHLLRVLAALPGPSGLVVHDTGTRAWRRRLMAVLARRFRRGAHLVLLDVTAADALEGQRRRRRTLHGSAFAAHWRNWHRLRAALLPAGPAGPAREPVPAGLAAEGWVSVRLLNRPAADRLRRVEIPAR